MTSIIYSFIFLSLPNCRLVFNMNSVTIPHQTNKPIPPLTWHIKLTINFILTLLWIDCKHFHKSTFLYALSVKVHQLEGALTKKCHKQNLIHERTCSLSVIYRPRGIYTCSWHLAAFCTDIYEQCTEHESLVSYLPTYNIYLRTGVSKLFISVSPIHNIRVNSVSSVEGKTPHDHLQGK